MLNRQTWVKLTAIILAGKSLNMDKDSRIQAENAFQEGKFLESSALYDKLLETNPQNLELLVGKANCLVFLGQWTDCFKYFAKAVQNKNWKSSCLDDLISNLLKALSDRREIRKRQCVAREIQQNLLCAICRQLLYNPTTLVCGHSFCRQCVLHQGKGKCFYCVNVHCDSNEVFVNVIIANVVESCFERKTKATELRHQGNDYYSQHNYREASKKYSEALELDPNNHLILSNLSHVSSALGNHQRALDYAEKVCCLMPKWEKGFYRKACAFLGLKNYSKAAVAHLQFLLIDPENEFVAKALSKVLIEMLTCESSVDTISSEKLTNSEQNEKFLLNQSPNVVLNDFASSLDALLNEQHSEMKDSDLKSSNIQEIETVLSEKLNISDLECSLCCRMFYHPVTCLCGHTFCQWCLNRCLDHNPSCPICRYPVEKFLEAINQNVTFMIELLCEKYFPKEFDERKSQHEVEMEKLASVALDTAEDIPVFVCALAIPSIPCPLHVFEPRYRLMVRECMESGSRQFGMCIPSQDLNSFSDYGVMLEIQDVSLLSDGRSLIQSVGGRRFKVLSRGMKDGYHTAKVEWLKDQPIPEEESDNITRRQLEVYGNVKNWLSSLPWFVKLRCIQLAGETPECDHGSTALRNGPNWIWWCVNLLHMEPNLKLEIIAMTDIRQRLDRIQDFIHQNPQN